MAAANASPDTREKIDNKRSSENTTIDRILECAVALNWNALAQIHEATALQVEYRIGPGQSLDYLKLWSSTTRGVSHLICEYWMQSTATHESGTTFTAGRYSGDFTWMLDAIMQHQRAFLAGSAEVGDGFVHVKRPTDADLASARADMNEALDRVGSHLRPALPNVDPLTNDDYRSEACNMLPLETMFVFVSKAQKGNTVISDAAIEVFKSASIQPRFLTLTHDDVRSLEFLAQQVKEILDRGVARDQTPDWLKPHKNGNGTAK